MTTNLQVRPFLMFQGQAEEAMRFYIGLFPQAELLELQRYAEGQPGKPGSVKRASFRLGDQVVQCTDSPVQHAFTFTPAFSLIVECSSEQELERLAGALCEQGSVLMPLGNYGFSRRFAWVNDRFGVSWQLNYT